jgi:TRAP transporter TAXI family solute receptor
MERKGIKKATILLTFFLLGILAGKGELLFQTEAQAAELSQKEVIPKVLTLATHPVGTLVNAMGTGLATVLSKHLGIEIKVMPTTGPIEWLPMVKGGEVDLGVLNNWDAQMGRLGKEEFKVATKGEGAPIYLLTSGTPALTGVVVAEDSGIRKGQDLKGKRYVGIFTGSGGITAQARAALANFGLKPSDVKMISVPGVEAGVRAIIEKRADATGSATTGMGVISELEASRGARFLSFDPSPEAVKRLQEHYPGYLVRVEPGPGKVGVKEPIYLMSYDFYLVASEKLSEEIAYTIVKTLWQHYPELGAIHVRLKEWTKDRFVTNRATIPYHPGAIKFYKEVGVWTPEMEALQTRLLLKR